MPPAPLTYSCLLVQRASEASEADYQSCSIEISDIYIYVCIRTSKYFSRASNYVS